MNPLSAQRMRKLLLRRLRCSGHVVLIDRQLQRAVERDPGLATASAPLFTSRIRFEWFSSLTPCFSGVFASAEPQNRFNGLDSNSKTVETVKAAPCRPNTPLKQGVNEEMAEEFILQKRQLEKSHV
jgi:hypothetical protein